MDAPSLAGRTAIAAVDDPDLALALVAAAAEARLLLAVACPDAATVVTINERDSPEVVGFAVSIDDPAGWERLVAHVEQRLGPIDGLLLALGDGHDAGALEAAVDAVARDMTARRVGIVATVGADPAAVEPASPVRRVSVPRLAASAQQAATLLAALADGRQSGVVSC